MTVVTRILLGFVSVLGAAAVYCALGGVIAGVWYLAVSQWDWMLFGFGPVVGGMVCFLLFFLGDAIADERGRANRS